MDWLTRSIRGRLPAVPDTPSPILANRSSSAIILVAAAVRSEWAIVGVISESDLLPRAETGTERRRPRWLEFVVGAGRLADDYAAARAHRVKEVMSENMASVSPLDDVTEAVRLMERRHASAGDPRTASSSGSSATRIWCALRSMA